MRNGKSREIREDCRSKWLVVPAAALVCDQCGVSLQILESCRDDRGGNATMLGYDSRPIVHLAFAIMLLHICAVAEAAPATNVDNAALLYYQAAFACPKP